MAGWRLGFGDARLEAQWQLKYAADQAALDTAVSSQTMLFPGVVARTLWAHFRSRSLLSSTDVAWLALFLAWAPFFLLLAHRRPAAYLRLRTPLVLLARLQHLLTIMRFAALFHEEAGGSAGLLPLAASPASPLGMLIWRPGSISMLLCTYLLLLRYNLPCAAAVLLATLHGTLRHCTSECRGSGQLEAAQQYADAAQQLRWRLPSLPGWAGIAGAACSGSRTFVGSCPAYSCRRSCVAVHVWLQILLGMLLPLVVSWAIEEASRCRFQRRWLGFHAPDDILARSPVSGLMRPLSASALTAWLLGCAWVLWLVMEAMVS